MGKRFSRALLGLCGTALAAAAIVWLAVAFGNASRTAERAASLCEVKLISESMATSAFSEAPEFILRDLAADGLPLARELRAKLNTTILDANGTEKAVADMLVGIAAEFRAKSNTTTAADATSDLESEFMLRTVFQCTMFGVVYGRFTVLRLGVTEDKAVDGMVTAYASAALDGLIAFLAELPQPEAQPTPPQPEAPSQSPESPSPTPQPETP